MGRRLEGLLSLVDRMEFEGAVLGFNPATSVVEDLCVTSRG
jgi:hypothetical protein